MNILFLPEPRLRMHSLLPLIKALALSVLLGACSLSSVRVQKVDAKVEQIRGQKIYCPPDRLDRCSDPSPLLALSAEDKRNNTHHVTLLEIGEDALKIRLHLIRAAQRSIDVQNFILRRDDTGELLLNELLHAARRGVRVRLLLDQMFTVSDRSYLVQLTLAHANFEIKFYNPSFYKAKMAKHDWISAVTCCFKRFNKRMHNKLMVVDDLVGVLGGRNISDRYYDFDTNYDFKDRDVAVFGNTVMEMRTYFDIFWGSKRSVPVQHLRDVASRLLTKTPGDLEPFTPAPRLLPLLEQITDQQLLYSLFIEPSFKVERLEYFSDLPRKVAFPDGALKKDISQELDNVFRAAQHSILIQSPYMVLSKNARKLFMQLREEKPDIELVFSTNSLASTDADTVYANTHKHKKRYVKKLGFKMYEFKPFPIDAPDFFPRWPQLIEEKKLGIKSGSVVSGDDSTISMPAPRVGLHAKSFVVDSKVAMIGSHNFDPRSEGFNTENGLIVWDEPFAQALEALIRRDIEAQNSWVVAMKQDRASARTNGHDQDVKTKTRYDSRLYGSTSVFELIPGREPVSPGSPDFYQNYYSVGSFPDVIKTRRQIMVLFLGSFFGFLEPIL